MPKLNLLTARNIKGAAGEFSALKGPGFSWVRPTGPRAWLPSDAALTIIIWLDAADTSTIGKNASNVVNVWRSRSGTRSAGQSVVASRPIWSADAVAVGIPAVQGDGVDDSMTVSGWPQISLSPVGLTIASTARVAAGGGVIAARSGTGASSGRWGHDMPVDALARTFGESAGINIVSSGSIDTATYRLRLGQVRLDRVGASHDGAAWTYMSASGGSIPDTTIPFNLFARDGGSWSQTSIHELVAYRGILSSADDERLRGYMLHKIGRPELLGSGHPYRNVPPMIT